MIRGAIERLRYAPAKFWRCVAVCGVVLFALYSVMAQARDPDGRYADSPNADWFRSQHNSQGQWCCDKSDGHRFYGEYKLKDDGSVVIQDDGKTYILPAYMVLKGTNPTGSAVWWYLDLYSGRTSYCFAPGALF